MPRSVSSQEIRASGDVSAGEAVRRTFFVALRRALHHLYDIVELRRNPLCALFNRNKGNDAADLRQVLEEGISALKPAPGLSPTSDAWRTYRVLYHRYIEQFDQASVAVNLGLSIRQMRRQEQLALQTLADWLIQRYCLDLTSHFGQAHLESAASLNRRGDAAYDYAIAPANVAQELRWAEQSFPSQEVDTVELVKAAIQTVQPIADTLGVSIHSDLPTHVPPALAQIVSMRQVLLNLLLTAIHSNDTVRVGCSQRAARIQIEIGPIQHRAAQDSERLAITEKLAATAGGHLEYRDQDIGGRSQTACFVLPLAGQISVLVVDDNADSLQLFERCLINSPYRFFGACDPQQTIPLTELVHPRVIVLDVMLPGVDGWEMLGRLHQHPSTRCIPVIICTILPQEELAAALGAAGFIRKPVTRDGLLLELDRQMSAAVTESDSNSLHMPAVDATIIRPAV